jgi:hypothetical protein
VLSGHKISIVVLVRSAIRIDLVMAQIGCPSLGEPGPDFLWRDDWTANR